jgi:hypothetical protein
MRKRDFEGVKADTEAMMVQAHELIVNVLKQYPALTKSSED